MKKKDPFLNKFGVSEKKFKLLAQKLPDHCLKEAYQNSFFLSTNDDADILEKRRFDLLDEVCSERGL